MPLSIHQSSRENMLPVRACDWGGTLQWVHLHATSFQALVNGGQRFRGVIRARHLLYLKLPAPCRTLYIPQMGEEFQERRQPLCFRLVPLEC